MVGMVDVDGEVEEEENWSGKKTSGGVPSTWDCDTDRTTHLDIDGFIGLY